MTQTENIARTWNIPSPKAINGNIPSPSSPALKGESGVPYSTYTYEYDSNGNLSKYVDEKNHKATSYHYDYTGKLVKSIDYDTNTNIVLSSNKYYYDTESRITSAFYYQDYLYNSTSYDYLRQYYSYEYNNDSTLKNLYIDVEENDFIINYNYDSLKRLTKKLYTMALTGVSNLTFSEEYVYETNGNNESLIISDYIVKVGSSTTTYKYTYDETYGNITEVKDSDGNLLYKYTYDSLDRLVREDNSEAGYTWIYTYDDNGNILTKKMYKYTLNSVSNLTPLIDYVYSYENSNWQDQLTEFNGDTITYDAMGNPLSYRDGMVFKWDTVNNLRSVTDIAGKKTSYTYNDEGIRTSKIVNGVEHIYTLEGSKILSEQYGNVMLVYLYDEAGSPIGFMYRESSYAKDEFDKYLFTKNLQGDILNIYNEDGIAVGGYKYNAWGQLCKTWNEAGYEDIVNLNPFRYRGYYFDTETGFYYLNSRYYDPITDRFISADNINVINATPNALTDKNLYAYCNNNPVIYIDPTGEIAWWVIAIIVVVVIAIDHALAKYVPDGVAVYDDGGEDGFHDQFLYAHGTGASIDKNGATLVDLEMGVYNGTTVKENMNFSIANFATGNAKAAIDWSGVPSIEASGVASVYRMSYEQEFNIFGKKISVAGNLYYGAIGAGAKLDFKEGKFKIMPPMMGMGGDFQVDFDW